VLRAARPAALLDARDRDLQSRARIDEDAHVQDAILLRADELLAVVEQDARVERVLDHELGNGPRLVDLADAQPAGERLVEREVVGDRVVPGEERCDEDPAVRAGLAELEASVDHV
jgi:hypothetical protein